MQYRLRTLLILVAVGPPMLAGGYLAWDRLTPKPSPWYIQDSFNPPILLPEVPGFRWRLTREGLKHVPDTDHEFDAAPEGAN